jgi:hypothetical protein
MNDLINYYQEKISTSREKGRIASRQNILWSVLRGGMFICILVSLYFAGKNQTWINGLGSGLFILTFIIALKQFEKTGKNLSYYQALKKVYEQELDNIIHSKFPRADGSEFQDCNHPYVNDLDVFGEHSLFHLLNRCSTHSGRSYLAEQLKEPLQNIPAIYERQAAIKELRNKKDFVFHSIAKLSIKPKAISNARIHLWLRQPNVLNLSKRMLLFIYALPFLNLALLVTAFINPDNPAQSRHTSVASNAVGF